MFPESLWHSLVNVSSALTTRPSLGASDGLVVKALDSQSRGPVIKTAGWLQGRLSLSSFRGHSTLSAETNAMVDALDITYFLSNELLEILFLKSVFHKMPDNQVPILAFTDNESLY